MSLLSFPIESIANGGQQGAGRRAATPRTGTAAATARAVFRLVLN
jgi:cysteine sulfinate desulfinase/cysteine desulfurase-like protein